MAEDREQQTEEATPRKREQLHEEGNVIRSQDVGAAAVVTLTCLVLGQSFETMARAVAVYAQRCFRLVDLHEPGAALRAQLVALAPSALPLVTMSIAATLVGIAQTRMFSFTNLMPKFSRMNPMNGLAQFMPSKQTFMEISKQMLKLLAVGYISFGVVADALPLFSTLSSEPPLSAAMTVAQTAAKLVLRTCIAFGVVAVIDYWLVRRKFLEDAKMTKQEVRDEWKAQEGNPQVKQQIRRKMQQMNRNRAKADVSKASVLVVNPTHYAVALRYEPEKDSAPVVLAKGLDELALQMRSVARHAGVPIVEQRPLARALYADAKVGRAVPVELYRAVAEVIAYVMQIKARDRGPLAAEPAGDA
ncbi:MAG TPA: EscU/YscU/HrcU family type III secretion system export apparatus switch protein [Polyangiales bacterium]|nr:EscU/YscU/HrcU family type III secretion system export apparatus switch protein [Polyangiales bacterium]